MTREEAKAWLEHHFDPIPDGTKQSEAVSLAIKALEQEPCDVFDEYGNYKYPSDVELTEPNTATSMPCEDAISREDALMCLTGEWTEITDEIIHRFIKRIKALPLVNPQPRWIPVSEILPKENKTVIASTDYCIYPEARYTEKCGWEGAYESGADYWVKIKDVIAWMSLPKPYVPETNIGKMSEIPTGSELQESEDR